jgi:hypothetical protein
MVVDLTAIRPYRNSQQHAFHELVCQIVRRTIAADNPTWRRVDGIGVEVDAFFDVPSGRVGVKAHFFLKMSDANWANIHQTFLTVLERHPTLSSYRVYIACDRGKPSGQIPSADNDRWDKACEQMEQASRSRGRDVSITLETASDIVAALARSECVGLSEFWFSTIDVTPNILKHWLKSAVDALGERFHPEDHVEIAAQQTMRVLSKGKAATNQLCSVVSELLRLPVLSIPAEWAGCDEAMRMIAGVNRARIPLATIPSILADTTRPWPVEEWRLIAGSFRSEIEALTQHMCGQGCGSSISAEIGTLRKNVVQQLQSIRSLLDLLWSNAFEAEINRAGIIIGAAGIGKSHLLAMSAAEITEEGGVCLLLLGHLFRSGQIWPQIIVQLGLPETVTRDQLLGSLDAASVAARKRGVIVIDAVDEGALKNGWSRDFDSFVDDIRAFSNLAVVVSCRDVYAPHVLGISFEERYPVIALRGFCTSREQEDAATTYMDRRGIARPVGPRLSPEFSNPLFLRTCCEGLSASGECVFPSKPISMSQLFEFYIIALGREISTKAQIEANVALSCRNALLGIAKQMADRRCDWVERRQALAAIALAFSDFASPDVDWLTLFSRVGVICEAPRPEDNSLSSNDTVIRFCVQWFQDHLIAASLLANVLDPRTAFSFDGQCNFLYNKLGLLSCEWNGLVEALLVQVPEKFGVEFLDIVPSGVLGHWEEGALNSAFVESVRRRDTSALTAQTLRFVDTIDGADVDLFIEFALRPDHPWNAKLLNSRLMRWNLWRRDSGFAVPLSQSGVRTSHPVNRLIDWCTYAPKEKVDSEILLLGALALTWILSSSSPFIRDRATWALSSLLTDRPDLFPELVEQFAKLDDLYVVERLLAAGYGVLIRHRDPALAAKFANCIAKHIFGGNRVLENILLRDYAAGIVAFASSLGALSSSIDLQATQPPYRSPRPRLTVTKAKLELTAKRANGDEILRHGTDERGAFYKCEIERQVACFSGIPLAKTPTLSSDQAAAEFEEALKHQSDAGKWQALDKLKSLLRTRRTTQLPIPADSNVAARDRPMREFGTRKQVRSAEIRLLGLLDSSEAKIYRDRWLPLYTEGVGHSKQVPTIAPRAAALWIAREAYYSGWTGKRFGERSDETIYDDCRQPAVESIGKKYLRLARSKLLCQLADNYWIHEGPHDGEFKQYRFATDIDRMRDFDPTLYHHPSDSDGESFGSDLGLTRVHPVILSIDGNSRLRWPFEGALSADPTADRVVTDRKGQRWLRLTWSESCARYGAPGEGQTSYNPVQRRFNLTRAVLCEPSEAVGLQSALVERRHIDMTIWNSAERVDGPFIYESWRGTWPNTKWRTVGGSRVAFPVEKCRWEPPFDRSFPDCASAWILAPWIMSSEGLQLAGRSPRIICSQSTEPIGWSSCLPDNEGMLIRENWLLDFLARENLACVWMIVGEREVWEDGNNGAATAKRRFNSVVRLHDGEMFSDRWYENCEADSVRIDVLQSS